MKDSSYHKLLLVIGVLALVWSGLVARDLFTWVLEVTPAVVAWILLIATYRKFKFSNLVYTLILLHSFVLMYGGIYTYAETPLGFWVSELFDWSRNNYDKLGHLMQGFVPVLVVREYFMRRNIVPSPKWLAVITVSVTLALSAFYEFVEWWVSLATGSAGDSFLGTQGYVWDTQSDMLMCLIGSIVALVLLSRLHDKSISKST